MKTTRTLLFLNKNISYMKKNYVCGNEISEMSNTSKTGPLQLSHSRLSTNTKLIYESKHENDRFQKVLPELIEKLLRSPKLKDLSEVANCIKMMYEYNLCDSNYLKGLTTVSAYEAFEKPENITEDTLKLARVLGWCVEMTQVCPVIINDILDNSWTKRGRTCWHRVQDNGLRVANDTSLLLTSVVELLEIYFGNKPYYRTLQNIFNEVHLKTAMGQHIDTTTAKRRHYNEFTMDRYHTIINHKTTPMFANLPFTIALILANIKDEGIHKKTSDVCFEITKLFQLQEDLFDCFGNESITNKCSLNIQEGKCTWLACKALERCSPAQRIVFERCYGSKDPKQLECIKRLYEQLQLWELSEEYKHTQYNIIHKKVNELPAGIPPKPFIDFTDMIVKRKY